MNALFNSPLHSNKSIKKYIKNINFISFGDVDND